MLKCNKIERIKEKIKKDLDKIANIISKEHFDIVAMQEVFDEKTMNMILQRLGRQWQGAWAKPNSRSAQAAEGYAFIWNTDRIMLAKSVTASGESGCLCLDSNRVFLLSTSTIICT